MKQLWKKYKGIILIVLAAASVFFLIKNSQVVAVKEINTENKVVNRSISASGEVKSRKEAVLAFNTTGKINSINVKKGDTVYAGQLLASVDSSSNYYAMKEARDARDASIRLKDIYVDKYFDNVGGVGGKTQYNLNLKKMDEDISQAENALSYQESLLKNTNIYAPFDGIVLDVYSKVGEVSTIGSEVLYIADPNDKFFEIKVDQEDYDKLREGMNAEIKLDSYGGKVLKAAVSKVPSYVTKEDVSKILVELDFSDKDTSDILLGMTGDGKVITESSNQEVKSLPKSAVQYENNKPYVWVINNGSLSKQLIEIGIVGEDFIEVKNSSMDKILIPAVANTVLTSGARFKIIK